MENSSFRMQRDTCIDFSRYIVEARTASSKYRVRILQRDLRTYLVLVSGQ